MHLPGHKSFHKLRLQHTGLKTRGTKTVVQQDRYNRLRCGNPNPSQTGGLRIDCDSCIQRHPGRIRPHPRIIHHSIHLQLYLPGRKTVVPRVAIAPHDVETPSPLADLWLAGVPGRVKPALPETIGSNCWIRNPILYIYNLDEPGTKTMVPLRYFPPLCGNSDYIG